VADATLVTIHGFWSSSAVWDQLDAIWAADDELQGLKIHPFGYASPKRPHLPFATSRVPDYYDIAQTLSTEYRVALAGADEVAFVTHSQGGLILQRFLEWMLNQGHGRELARIRTIVMLACPNAGSEYLRSIRHMLGLGRHPQAANLAVLNRQVADTERAVLERIVNAIGVDEHQCRIPFHVYAGDADRIVTAASAQGAFPGAGVLAGNHSSILNPAAPGNRTAETVKHHLAADLSDRPTRRLGAASSKLPDSADDPLATERRPMAPGHSATSMPASLPAPAVSVRLIPEVDTGTNRFRLGALNRGNLGNFRAEVVDAHDQDGNWIGPRSWPMPWLDDGSVKSKEIPTFGKPLLDFAQFDFLGLKQDLDGTKWLNGNHWVFVSLPQPVKASYSAVRYWSELDNQHFVITVRVIRDDPPGYVDTEFNVGVQGTEPYCRELPEKASGMPMPAASGLPLVRGQIAARRDRDARLFQEVGDVPSQRVVLDSVMRAQKLGIVPEQGCRVDLVSDCYLRFRTEWRSDDPITRRSNNPDIVKLTLERIDGAPLCGIEWTDESTAAEIAVVIAEEMQAAGVYSGDALYDPGQIFADLSMLLKVGHNNATAGKVVPVRHIVELCLPQWAVCYDGVYSLDVPYQIAAWRLNENWHLHMREKPWVDMDSLEKALYTCMALYEAGSLDVKPPGPGDPPPPSHGQEGDPN
jgi:pimeloyl-ACP methyl ester carboxylesterase